MAKCIYCTSVCERRKQKKTLNVSIGGLLIYNSTPINTQCGKPPETLDAHRFRVKLTPAEGYVNTPPFQ